MADKVVEAVARKLLSDEEEYEKKREEFRGFRKVIYVLRRLERVLASKLENGENTQGVNDLLSESLARLDDVISEQADGKQAYTEDFNMWAADIEADIRARDPLTLSIDSGSDEDNEKLPSSKLGRDGGTPSKGASTMLSILKSGGQLKSKRGISSVDEDKEERHFCLTTVAWTVAVIGMMITIGFLAGDFMQAQKNFAIQVERSVISELDLPAITVCSSMPHLPTFAQYPIPEFPGLPLFGISSYTRSNRSGISPEMQLFYPKTLSNETNSPIEDVFVAGEKARCNKSSYGFDVLREMSSLRSVQSVKAVQMLSRGDDSCLSCFRLGYKKRETLQPYDVNAGSVLSAALQIRLFRPRLFDACQTTFSRRNPVVDSAFASELLLHAKELEQRGILDFNGQEYNILKKSQQKLKADYFIDFYCNVYFFSGFFYPSLDKADISYRFESKGRGVWEKTGKGPYYSAYTWDKAAPLLQGPDPRALQKDTYALNAVRLYAEEASSVNTSRDVLPSTSLSIVDSSHSSMYAFRRVMIEGTVEYHAKEHKANAPKVSLKAMDLFLLSFDFETFETEKITTSPTMSWPEFVTDIFEFIGLFTGICIFTLIVAPAHSLA